MTNPLIQELIDVARSQVGVREHGRNTGKSVRMYQAATNLNGTGWPWCAAFVCWVIQETMKQNPNDTKAYLGKIKPETWRPKTAAAYGFEDWARKWDNVTLLGPTAAWKAGDIITFAPMSHVGIVVEDKKIMSNRIYTIEGNTNASGGREGDGVFSRDDRRKDQIRKLIRFF